MAYNSTIPDVLTELYAGTDFSSLSWLEQQWVAWYVWIGNPIIATGLMSFLMHEVCFCRYSLSLGMVLSLGIQLSL
jgi:methylsterol monooxygenase